MKKYCIETLNKIMSNKISKYYSTFFKIEKDDMSYAPISGLDFRPHP